MSNTAFPDIGLVGGKEGGSRAELFAFADAGFVPEGGQTSRAEEWKDRTALPRSATATFVIHPDISPETDSHIELVTEALLGDDVTYRERQNIVIQLLRQKAEKPVKKLIERMFAEASADKTHALSLLRNYTGRLVEPTGTCAISTKEIETRTALFTKPLEPLFRFFTNLQTTDSVADNAAKLRGRHDFDRGSVALYEAAGNILTSYYSNGPKSEAAHVLNGLGWLVYFRSEAMKRIAEMPDKAMFLSMDGNPWIGTTDDSRLANAQPMYETIVREYMSAQHMQPSDTMLDISEMYNAVWPKLNNVTPIVFNTPSALTMSGFVRFPHTATVTVNKYK